MCGFFEWLVGYYVGLFVGLPVAGFYRQARYRLYTGTRPSVYKLRLYRRRACILSACQRVAPLKPECGSTNLSNANQNKNLMIRNKNLMFSCVGVIT
jgi:hypothetical protein